MYLTPTDLHWIIDIEGDGLEDTVTRVWCVCVENVLTGEKRTFLNYDEYKEWMAQRLAEECIFVGHNIIKYDAPVSNRLVGTRLPVSRLVDTFLLSMHYSPSLVGGHSLDAWSGRLGGERKKEHEDWTQLSQAMIERCEGDVRINKQLYLRLARRMRDVVGFTERSCELEHRAWHIISKQQKNGFAFNYRGAHELLVEVRAKQEELKEKIYHKFPPKLQRVAAYKQCYKLDGTFNKQYQGHLAQYPELRMLGEGAYEAYDFVEFNLGSPQQRVEKLLELGWVPEEFTPKTDKGGGGNPKPTDKGELSPSLAKFAEEGGVEEVKLIAQWMALQGRASALNNWMNLYNDKTGCLHGNLWLANTLRYRHSDPNTANIPRVRKNARKEIVMGTDGYYTYESRDLWTTRDPVNRVLVGVDATGIQFRVLAHYLNNEEFTNVILSGDIHEYNRSKTGVGDRDQNKTFGYAALLGAGGGKTGTIFRVSEAQGKKIKDKWIKTVPGLKELYNRLQSELTRTGRITLCDGSKVLVSSPHMVLAYLLQGDESRIMKQAMIYVDERVRKEKLDVLKVGDIHDEVQADVLRRDTERYIQICKEGFKLAGLSFSYNLPIECDAKVGLTWAETH